MGCGASHPAAAAVTPLAAQPIIAQKSPTSKASAGAMLSPGGVIMKEADEEKVAEPIANKKKRSDESDPLVADGRSSSISIAAGSSKHKHHHKRGASISHPNNRSSESLIPSNSAGPEGSPPTPLRARSSVIEAPAGVDRKGSLNGHHRTASGHSRSRSFSVVGVDGALSAGSSRNLLDVGADGKDQMMANKLKNQATVNVGSPETDARPIAHRRKSSMQVNHLAPSASDLAAPVLDEGEEADEDGDENGDEHKHHGKKERKKKQKIIKTLELADLQHLSADNLEALWKQYDKDKNGSLDRKELKRLAKDCIGRTINMCEEEIRRQQPKLTEQELKGAVEKELKFVLPGAAKEQGKKEDVQKEMVRRLVKKLDVNGDGDVTKAELLATWNVFAKELFQMKAAEGPVGCSIM